MAAEKPASSSDAGHGLLQAALDQVIDALWARVRCERASIMLADGEGAKALLGMAVWRGQVAEAAVSARVISGASIAGKVYATRQSMRIDDVDGSKPSAGARGEGGSFICVPLQLDGRVLGVINVRRPRGDASFSPADEGVLECLALYAGKAIQSAQLAYLLNSGFAQRALESEQGGAAHVANSYAQGAAQPAQLARLLAKSFYREMKQAGFGPNQIVGAAGEIIEQLSGSLRKHGERMGRKH